MTIGTHVDDRDGERTGVWRYSEKANGSRNYYLVTEALDEAGNATELLIRNEETGKDEWASLFAVRVPEATYNRVAADKQDNGIIEDDQIGSKPRGSLSPRFRMPTTGGYITEESNDFALGDAASGYVPSARFELVEVGNAGDVSGMSQLDID